MAEIDWLERTFAAPDTRPLSQSDLAAGLTLDSYARRNRELTPKKSTSVENPIESKFLVCAVFAKVWGAIRAS
jgi:hypothetical protein